MLAHGTAMLADALAGRRAVAAFATYNLEMVQAATAAAEQTDQPVIVLAGSSHFQHAGRSALMTMAVQAAQASTATIGVHLDHCRDLAEIELCVRGGYSSVMVDGSHLPFDDNIALTRAAVSIAHPVDVWVEAELGAIPGDEDVSTNAAPARTLTDPMEAAEFVQRTGVDALAVAVGNVHGLTSTPISLDLERLPRSAPRFPSRWSCMAPAACLTRSSAERSAAAWPRSTSTPSCGRPTSRPSSGSYPRSCPPTTASPYGAPGREAVTTAAVRSIHALDGNG